MQTMAAEQRTAMRLLYECEYRSLGRSLEGRVEKGWGWVGSQGSTIDETTAGGLTGRPDRVIKNPYHTSVSQFVSQSVSQSSVGRLGFQSHEQLT